ncbi:hypothetical protein JCM30566_10780 [Marinitoga arctica]
MKKLFLLFVMLYISIISLSYTNINFSFIFTFGSTNTTYSQIVRLKYINDSSIATVTFYLKKYPEKIKINNEEYDVYSQKQKFIIPAGKMLVKYNNKEFEFLLENEELDIGLSQQVVPKVKIISYTKVISPNDDWYNDNLKIILYSNTYGYIKLFNEEKRIYPGKNILYFPINLEDDSYITSIIVYNEKGEFKKDIKFKVDRTKKTATKYILLSILGLFITLIGYSVLNQ